MKQIYIHTCESYIPPYRQPVQEAISTGCYPQHEAHKDQYKAIAQEKNLWPVDMVIECAKRSIQQSNFRHSQISFLTYSYIHRQGQKHLWQPAAYLQHKLDINQSLAVSVNHGCNSMMLCAKLAMDHLTANDNEVALITSADRFNTSDFDRWQSDYAVVYGDAAVAALLSTHPGPFEILHFQHCAVSELEIMHRQSTPKIETQVAHDDYYDTRSAKKDYLNKHGKEAFILNMQNALQSLKKTLMEETSLGTNKAKWLVLPNVGKSILSHLYEPIFLELAERNFWEFGQYIGHAGASDQFLGLALLKEKELLKPGDRIILIGAGAGFSCSTMLIEYNPKI
ncbi:hypothetical protein BGP78_13795 [Pseudoalteromonas sp. MSK9-3]|uniref:ketoacyl-ACP synthase III family protein n=1 Tax=Pseudoalteromonas sp. MSK9-3 TaxID=1897633 RepID=UPI000E6B717C|nr:ketoacyl-ACP synthase III family protein [Pseudoalteromonas sp. MSK9-3]RJE76081.1 hypothetical protein BGP78_13795 [Pseudoalteromonas sp. MSK9-3]